MRGRVVALGLSCLLGWTAGCQSHDSNERADKAEPTGATAGDQPTEPDPDQPSPPAKDDRLPEFSAPAVGLAPGYLDGAMLYLNWRAGLMQELLHSLPLAPNEARDLAEVSAALGVDLRVDDALRHFGVDANARVSLSVRPLVDGADQLRVRAESEQGSNPATLREAEALGLHLRVHLPVAEPSKLDGLIAKLAAETRDETWAQSCAAIGPSRACGGDSSGVAVLRDVPGGLQVDALMLFRSNYEQPDSEPRRAKLLAALQAPAVANNAELAGLRGDAVMLVDGPGFVQAMRADVLARLVGDLSTPNQEYSDVERLRDRVQAIDALHDTARLFDGLTLEALISRDRMLALGRWRASARGQKFMREVFALDPVDADVPTIAALCDGALLCARTRGLPQRSRFAPLATGLYASPEQLGEALDDNEDEAAALLLLETWPNAIGTTALLPGNDVEPAEAMIINNVVGMATRVLGFGLSVRSLSQARQALVGDWFVYARTTAPDLAAVRGFMQLAEVSASPIDISGVPGRIDFAPIPEPDLPGNYYAVYDPKAATGEWGWAVLADGDDRVRALASLPRDDGAVPLAYFEIGDLWRLVASFEESRAELSFAQSWLARRWVRAQISLGDDGAPELRVAMGKLE